LKQSCLCPVLWKMFFTVIHLVCHQPASMGNNWQHTEMGVVAVDFAFEFFWQNNQSKTWWKLNKSTWEHFQLLPILHWDFNFGQRVATDQINERNDCVLSVAACAKCLSGAVIHIGMHKHGAVEQHSLVPTLWTRPLCSSHACMVSPTTSRLARDACTHDICQALQLASDFSDFVMFVQHPEMVCHCLSIVLRLTSNFNCFFSLSILVNLLVVAPPCSTPHAAWDFHSLLWSIFQQFICHINPFLHSLALWPFLSESLKGNSFICSNRFKEHPPLFASHCCCFHSKVLKHVSFDVVAICFKFPKSVHSFRKGTSATLESLLIVR